MQFVLVAITFILTACGNAISEPPQPPLAATEWELISMKGNDLIEGTQITLGFRQDDFSGLSGCNLYGDNYTATDQGNLSILEISATEMLVIHPRVLWSKKPFTCKPSWRLPLIA
ncbi:MAG: META domain-containing protein [Chloroflexi bacterium]|nr:META domain-containing protein [Chloroflexota bacterium]